MSRNKLFLIISLWTEPLKDYYSLIFRSLAVREFAFSSSSAFLRTKAIYTPGEWGIKRTRLPSAGLIKLIYSIALEAINLVNECSQESSLVILRLVQANSLSFWTNVSFCLSLRDLFLNSYSIDLRVALSCRTSASFSLF